MRYRFIEFWPHDKSQYEFIKLKASSLGGIDASYSFTFKSNDDRRAANTLGRGANSDTFTAVNYWNNGLAGQITSMNPVGRLVCEELTRADAVVDDNDCEEAMALDLQLRELDS